MGPMMKTYAESFRFSNNIAQLALSDLTEEAARTAVRDGEGASIAWIMGHLIGYRIWAMQMMGGEIENPWMEKYNQSRAADVSDYPMVAEFLEAWAATDKQLEAAMAQVSDEQLRAPAGPPGAHGEQSLAHWLTFITWHEANHFGAIGMIRPELGFRPISELAMEARAG